MGIDSHGNNGHSHSHAGCFPFLPIPIPDFVTNSHYHGTPMGFPFPLGIPFPWSSLLVRVCKPGIGRYYSQWQLADVAGVWMTACKLTPRGGRLLVAVTFLTVVVLVLVSVVVVGRPSFLRSSSVISLNHASVASSLLQPHPAQVRQSSYHFNAAIK